ncbi:hypothetical protein CLF_104187 [Clonorchis sinensis]|uniref:Uncharacterized protein n=1 Tax=Clonorchis sinensis TaxID=79923 RepID=H2KTK3_CLOSI|nr:hypothetical protein CLF_104187 [Clonorchis sinensis]
MLSLPVQTRNGATIRELYEKKFFTNAGGVPPDKPNEFFTVSKFSIVYDDQRTLYPEGHADGLRVINRAAIRIFGERRGGHGMQRVGGCLGLGSERKCQPGSTSVDKQARPIEVMYYEESGSTDHVGDEACDPSHFEKASIVINALASEICQRLDCRHQGLIYNIPDHIPLERIKTALLAACNILNPVCTVWRLRKSKPSLCCPILVRFKDKNDDARLLASQTTLFSTPTLQTVNVKAAGTPLQSEPNKSSPSRSLRSTSESCHTDPSFLPPSAATDTLGVTQSRISHATNGNCINRITVDECTRNNRGPSDSNDSVLSQPIGLAFNPLASFSVGPSTVPDNTQTSYMKHAVSRQPLPGAAIECESAVVCARPP